MPSLFITGYGGYIGQRLLATLDPRPYDKIYCLSRRSHALNSLSGLAPKPIIIETDIIDTSSYAKFLTADTTVLHLAAITGKHSPATFFRVNRDGTHALLNVCRRAGVSRFIHVSTIAVNYKDTHGYYYAISKRQAELAVKASGLSHTIVRPSMVIGPDSPNWLGLARLAGLPITPIFGPGTNLIQPIYIDDLVDFLQLILSQHICSNESIELGGPQQLTLKAFLKTIRTAYYKKGRCCVHIPVRPLRFLLTLLDPMLHRFLPLTSGQLCAFTNNSTIHSNPLHDHLKPTILDVSSMINQIKHHQASGCADDDPLGHECTAFTAYLVKRTPSTYIQDKYKIAHNSSPALREPAPTLVDQWLVATASRGPWRSRLVDVYTRLFLPCALIRKKWIVLLAILESSPDTYDEFDTPSQTPRVRVFSGVLARASIAALLLGVSFLVLFPIHVALLIRSHSKFRSS